MKICFMCDLHLPPERNALQYKVMQWAIDDAIKKNTDCIVFAGDVTCDGNFDVYSDFIEKMDTVGIPFVFIPGNSDLRNMKFSSEICNMHSPVRSILGNTCIFAVNDADRSISEDVFEILESAKCDDIVFMHHPITELDKNSSAMMKKWRERHSDVFLFCGHSHTSSVNGKDIQLQAMDPDKAIGENPCITYFDTETKSVRKAYYFSPVPTDFYNYFGISCYDTIKQIEFAIENKLKYIELRPACINEDEEKLLKLINDWRSSGGVGLSVHMPDVYYCNGRAYYEEPIEKYINLINKIDADRITQHVPVVAVGEANDSVLSHICSHIADTVAGLAKPIIIGIENMHMTPSEKDDNNRRFGYTPDECERFIDILSDKTCCQVGFNFDIGHARNNAPFSRYQISTWLALLGKRIVGYHIHQVTPDGDAFENHMPITDIYGKLISYSSLFRNWTEGCVNKAPIIFEMRGSDSYQITLDTFSKHRCNIFDIHSHTYYSSCGRDDPRELIRTAVNNGISMLGISDHAHCIKSRKDVYLKELHSVAKEFECVITILRGIEINTLPQYFDINKAYEIAPFDYCLLESITNPESQVGPYLIDFCNKIDTVCGIAHTDLFEYCTMYGYDPEEYFALMAENNIFWEMNVTYDSIHRYREHQYVFDFMNDENKLRIVRESRLPISIGNDSHRCEDYDGFKVHSMYHFLKLQGIRTADEVFKIR